MRLRKEPSRTVVVEGQGINTLQHAVPAPCRSRRKYTKVNSAERKKTDSPVSQNFQWMVARKWLFPFPLFPVYFLSLRHGLESAARFCILRGLKPC